ncbi:MAG: hypothetical protein H6612_04430 [Ignavibacteriales bacterium]|nr:hypothetical protein [Ignavibacteriales bacterium]
MKNFGKVLIMFIALANLTFSQVDLEINDGMTVETTGGLVIEVSGDVIENGSGYLLGSVTSGDRGTGGVTNFAGLSLTNGVNQITRNTGSDYNGTTAPKTVLRNYQVTTSSNVTANADFSFNNTTPNNESNGLDDKFIYTHNGSTWKGYSDNGSTASIIKAKNVVFTSASPTNVTLTEGVGLASKIYLEGPYTSLAMSDNLGTLPAASPYTTEAPRTASSIPSSAVDWVLLEIRTSTAPSSIVGYRSAFIDTGGNIINDVGHTTGVGLPGVDGTDYYVVVRHRNHLPIMSNTNPTLTWLNP